MALWRAKDKPPVELVVANLKCVDMETACIYETATLLKDDIFYLEVDSLDNELLKYTNEKIEG